MKTLKLKASSDDLDLAVAYCEPEGREPLGIVQIVHGMCEHKERYYQFMEHLSANGFVAVIHDHRGHGESVKCADDLGFMYKDGWNGLIEDVTVVNRWARSMYPTLKCTLLGHSMGSMVVRSFAKRHDDMIDALIVCGSASMNPAAGVGKLLADTIGLFRGTHHRPMLIQKMSFEAYNKPFKDEGYKSAWVCSDREVLEAYHKDPLCQYVFTANGFSNLMSLMMDCYSKKGWKMSNPALPVHFISGEFDPCRVNDKEHQKSVDLMKAVGYSDVDSKVYKGMRHEILNETRKAEVWADVLEMLAK